MKQVARYSKFLFSIVFRRWSYYVSTFVYLLVLAAVLFLVSAVLNKPVSITLMYYGFNMMVILAGAITAAIYSVQLFRAGIDDGTELLVTAKPIKRNEMLAGKCIVLATLILMLSLLSMCLGFLTYFTVNGDTTYTFVGGGVFLATLLVLLFFSGVALVFCLITKKMGATLATIGTCFLFMMYCFADTILSTGPSKYIEKNNVDITILNPVNNVIDDKNVLKFETTEGAVAKSKITKNAITYFKNNDGKFQKANSQFLSDIWHRALVGLSRYSMMVLDPIFQWSELMNLQNYLLDSYQSGFFYEYIFSSDTMTNGNLKFSKKNVDFSKFINWSINENAQSNEQDKFVLLKNNNLTVNFGSTSLNWTNAFEKNISTTAYIPNFSLKGNNTNISLKPYVINEKNSWETFNNLFFNSTTGSESIVNDFKNKFDKLINANLLSNLKSLNTVSCIQTYLTSAFIQILNNQTIFNKFESYTKKENPEFKLVNLNNQKEFVKLLKEDPKLLFANLIFINKLSLNTLMQIQISAFNYLQSSKDFQSPLYKNAMSILGADSITPSINTYYSIFTMPYWLFDGFVTLAAKPFENTNEIVRQLINIINSCFASFNQPPLSTINELNLTTFTQVKIVPYLSLGGILGVWFTLTFLLLIIGAILYSRKDII